MSQLETNTESLRDILSAVNALPDASGGGSTPADPVLQEKTVTPTKEVQSITPDTGYDGLFKVDVGAIPDEYIIPNGTMSITENGTHNVREVESVNVNVPAPETVMQEKTVTPAATIQMVEPDAGYDGLSKVTVNGDANLLPENIASGVSIFGVSGTFEGGDETGGLPAGVTAMASGILTPSNDISSTYYISHGLGVKPNFFSIVALGDFSTSAKPGVLLSQTTIGKPFSEGDALRESTMTTIYALASGSITGITNTYSGMSSTTRCFIEAGSSYVLKAGVSYRWIACVLELN